MFQRFLPFRLFAGCLAGATLAFAGCATVINGTTQAVPIGSEPAGAQVIVDGHTAGVTPTTLKLDRKHSHIVTLELAGYATENVALTNTVGGAVAGNIVLGGLIGWGVDATSGAQYNLHPDTVNVSLRPLAAPGAPGQPISAFAKELAKLDELHAGGRVSDAEYSHMRAALFSSSATTEQSRGNGPAR